MVASVNQDFVTYRGDTVKPIFTVVNSSGVAVDISSVTEITWTAKLNNDGSALITKTKTGGGITFVTTGADGKFQVNVLPADTLTLSGFYLHYASLVDGAGNVSTVSVGRMQVGVAPLWSYNPMELANSALYRVRLLIGDVLQGDQQLMDAEINFYISQYSNENLAAAAACRTLAFRFARLVDISEGQLQKSYSQRSRQYFMLQKDLEQRGYAAAVDMYAGGISISDVQTVQADTDRVQPEFTIGMSDNMLPIGPVGVQQPLGNTGASLAEQL